MKTVAELLDSEEFRKQAQVLTLDELQRAYPECSSSTVRRAWRIVRKVSNPAPVTEPETDKKSSTFHWREASQLAQKMQKLAKSASVSQDYAFLRFPDMAEPMRVLPISDWHFGSYGTDYRAVEKWTDRILSTPNLYVALIGDMLQMAIKLRNVLEVSDNLLTPKLQMRFLETWLSDLKPRILFATWDNHSVMREESAAGVSQYAQIMADKTIYHTGIGHEDIIVGKQVYKLCSSHRFRGTSMYNPVHAQQRYLRMEAPDRDIAIQGDTHVPGFMQYVEGGKMKTVINCGSLQTGSGYASRHFSLKTWAEFPCFTLSPTTHRVTPFWSLDAMLE